MTLLGYLFGATSEGILQNSLYRRLEEVNIEVYRINQGRSREKFAVKVQERKREGRLALCCDRLIDSKPQPHHPYGRGTFDRIEALEQAIVLAEYLRENSIAAKVNDELISTERTKLTELKRMRAGF